MLRRGAGGDGAQRRSEKWVVDYSGLVDQTAQHSAQRTLHVFFVRGGRHVPDRRERKRRFVAVAAEESAAVLAAAKAARAFHTGPETLRDAGGRVTRVTLGSKWLIPPVVVVTSLRSARDVLGRMDPFAERGARRSPRNCAG